MMLPRDEYAQRDSLCTDRPRCCHSKFHLRRCRGEERHPTNELSLTLTAWMPCSNAANIGEPWFEQREKHGTHQSLVTKRKVNKQQLTNKRSTFSATCCATQQQPMTDVQQKFVCGVAQQNSATKVGVIRITVFENVFWKQNFWKHYFSLYLRNTFWSYFAALF